jgi:putative ABC transport system permease protein
MSIRFWLRWTWRDLRKRLLQVVAIAAIIALGSGLYAGLGSTSVWRLQSLNATFTGLAAHDVEISPVTGFFAPQNQLLNAVRSAGGPGLRTVEVRLVANLPVRAGRSGQIAAAGVIVGVDLAHRVDIDRWKVVAGQTIGSADSRGTSVLLDEHFVNAHHLASTGIIDIGGTPVRYVGTALEPEYLNTTVTFGATIQGAATRAVVYAPIRLVQRLADRPGQANDVVALVSRGSDVQRVAATLSNRLPGVLPGMSLTVTVRQSDPSTLALYDEISSEQKIFDVFALLILAGAGFAAFNLMRRVVESQRRDIGIAMSLGVTPSEISIRPLVMAVEVAVAGVVLGILVGWGTSTWVLHHSQSQVPLPFWRTPWQGGLFLRGAALGLFIPLLGSAYPVWRSIRVAPTDALLAPHLRNIRHWAGGLTRGVRLPGSTLVEAPIRRITIAPTRSVMTVLSIGLILAPLLAAFGTTDSASSTINSETRISSGSERNQLLVSLTSYQPAASSAVSAVVHSSLVASYALGLDTGGYLVRGSKRLGVSISMVDLSNPLAVPMALASQKIASGGIVISTKAASDLGTRVGGSVILRHPLRQGLGYRFVDTRVPVRAVVNSPYVFLAYMSLRDEQMMGLQGIVNAAVVVPRSGVSMNQLQRGISSLPGVAWALPSATLANTIRDLLALVANLFIVLQIVIGLLAFLVAYNSTKIGSDERAREHATMMAFGVRARQIVLIGVAESVILGVMGVGVGLAVGLLILHWVLATVFPAAVPELSVLPSIAMSSYLLTALIGLVAAALAPTLVTRQLQRMSLPSALRFVE